MHFGFGFLKVDCHYLYFCENVTWILLAFIGFYSLAVEIWAVLLPLVWKCVRSANLTLSVYSLSIQIISNSNVECLECITSCSKEIRGKPFPVAMRSHQDVHGNPFPALSFSDEAAFSRRQFSWRIIFQSSFYTDENMKIKMNQRCWRFWGEI